MGWAKTLLKLIINTKEMYKSRDKYSFSKKIFATVEPQSIYNSKIDSYSTNCIKQFETQQSRFNTIPIEESPLARKPLNQANQFGSSSRIANEGEAMPSDYQSFQTSILRKVECIQEQSNKLLQKKQRQIYFLKVDLKSYELRLQQAELEIKRKSEFIDRLEDKISKLNGQQSKYFSTPASKNMQQLQQENQKLKQSLRIMIEDKNQNWKSINKPSHHTDFSYGKLNVQGLKRQVEQLRAMVAEMQEAVISCPGCYTLRRQNQELSEAYDYLVKQHSEFIKTKSSHEKQLLQNISIKIQDNQNILRQNIQLKQQRNGRPFPRKKGQRLKECVAKRCRTLTDQF